MAAPRGHTISSDLLALESTGVQVFTACPAETKLRAVTHPKGETAPVARSPAKKSGPTPAREGMVSGAVAGGAASARLRLPGHGRGKGAGAARSHRRPPCAQDVCSLQPLKIGDDVLLRGRCQEQMR